MSVSSSKCILLLKADSAFYVLSLLNVSPFPFPLSLFSLSHLGYWNAYPSSVPFSSVSPFRANLPSPTVIFLKENFTFVRTLLKNFELFRIVWKFNIAFRLVISGKKNDFPEYSVVRLNWTAFCSWVCPGDLWPPCHGCSCTSSFHTVSSKNLNSFWKYGKILHLSWCFPWTPV